jgi:hypothetical protein
MNDGRRQSSCDDTSRMNREVHVRFCERLGVKFPGPTRQDRSFDDVRIRSASLLMATRLRTLHYVSDGPFSDKVHRSKTACYSITSSARAEGAKDIFPE